MTGSADDDALAVEHHPQPQHAVGGRVLRADVEHHVGGREPAGARGDVERALAGLGGHAVSLPHARRRTAGQQPARVSPPVAQPSSSISTRTSRSASGASAELGRRRPTGSAAAPRRHAVVQQERRALAHRDVEGLLVVLVDVAVGAELPGARPPGPARRACRRRPPGRSTGRGRARRCHRPCLAPVTMAEVERAALDLAVGRRGLRRRRGARRRRLGGDAARTGVAVTVTTTSRGCRRPQAARLAQATTGEREVGGRHPGSHRHHGATDRRRESHRRAPGAAPSGSPRGRRGR